MLGRVNEKASGKWALNLTSNLFYIPHTFQTCTPNQKHHGHFLYKEDVIRKTTPSKLPVGVSLFCDDRLKVCLQEVPYVEVGCGVQHTEDGCSGLGPLDRDHRVPCRVACPLKNRLLTGHSVESDTAVPTANLEHTQDTIQHIDKQHNHYFKLQHVQWSMHI